MKCSSRKFFIVNNFFVSNACELASSTVLRTHYFPCSDLPAYWISFSLDSLEFFFHPEVHAYREFFFRTHFFPDNPEVSARWMGILQTHLSFRYTGEPAQWFFFFLLTHFFPHYYEVPAHRMFLPVTHLI
jgi:hypothetical protein